MNVFGRIVYAVFMITMLPALTFLTLMVVSQMTYYKVRWNETFREQWDEGLGQVVKDVCKVYYKPITSGELYIPNWL